VLLSYFDAGLSEQNRNAVKRDACEQQLDREGVAETMCVAILDLRVDENLLKLPLPVCDGRL
jgi:hypothetical protein